MKPFLKACFVTALLAFAVGALASPTIELKDGSRIQGEIQGLANGVYTVVSPSIGTVHVAASDVARIVYSGGSSNKPPVRDDELSRNILQLQSSLAQDPGTMASIMNLQSDPQIQAILTDPAIARAIQDGDYTSLLDNPKIKALENNAQLKRLLEQQEH